MSDQKLMNVKKILENYDRKYRLSVFRWKLGYRALLVTSLISTLLSAAVVKFRLNFALGVDNLAAALALLATVITGIIASFRFEENWRINRRFRHQVSLIIIESEKSTANPDELLSMLQQVIMKRSDELTK